MLSRLGRVRTGSLDMLNTRHLATQPVVGMDWTDRSLSYAGEAHTQASATFLIDLATNPESTAPLKQLGGRCEVEVSIGPELL